MKDIKEYLTLAQKSVVTYVTLVAALVAILAIKGSVTLSIEYRCVVASGCVLVPIVTSAIRLIRKKNQELRSKSEEIDAKNEEICLIKKSAAESMSFAVKAYDHEGDKDLFYIEYSEYLPEDTIVSIYYRNTNNKIICCGRVLDVDPECYITVEVIKCTVKDGREHLFSVIKTTDSSILDNVFIKLLVKNEAVQKLAYEMMEANKNGNK